MVLERSAIPVAVAAALAAACFACGWYAKGVKADRDRLEVDLAELRGVRVLEARDRRLAGEASAEYQQVLQQIRAVVAAVPTKEEKDALQVPVHCADGASAVQLGDVPVPAVLVDRLRSAGADREADRPTTR